MEIKGHAGHFDDRESKGSIVIQGEFAARILTFCCSVLAEIRMKCNTKKLFHVSSFALTSRSRFERAIFKDIILASGEFTREMGTLW